LWSSKKGFNVDPVVSDIKEALERERIAEQAIGWSVLLFPTPAIKRMLIVGVGVAVAQQAVGIDAIQYYLIDVLKESGIESDKGRLGVLMMLGVLKLVFIFIGGKLFDRKGRRPMFFVSLAGKNIGLLDCTNQLRETSSLTIYFEIRTCRRIDYD
jgi:MFS family permease